MENFRKISLITHEQTSKIPYTCSSVMMAPNHHAKFQNIIPTYTSF